jgi:predicted HicB family RNase H-like nuclease
MKNVLEHKGYTGNVEFNADDEVFYGKILGIRDVVSFEADSVQKLKKAFREAVDFKGSFNVRIKPKLHRLAVIKSAALKISLNQLVEKALEKEVSR